MFRALICSSSGGNAYTTIGILFVRIISFGCWQLPVILYAVRPDDEQTSA
jgi:hypothetical protein